jgi:serine/threonine-protein phosphatase 2A activator
LDVVRRLQKVYRLEPAGSHGYVFPSYSNSNVEFSGGGQSTTHSVWGLDDFQHLPYLWGAAQLYGR